MRYDGSIETANIASNSSTRVFDYGIHYAMVLDVVYTDNPENDSAATGGADPKEVLYDVIVSGGRRDGQVFFNVPLMRHMSSGTQNYSEITLKPYRDITRLDIGSEFNVSPFETFGNGDTIYIQFIDGDLHTPVIVGYGKNTANPHIEATEDERQRKKTRFNGIESEVDKDGVYTWTKDIGQFTSLGARVNDPTTPLPLIEEFQPAIEKAISLKVDNEAKVELAYSAAGAILGADPEPNSTFSIDFINDALTYSTTSQTQFKVDGIGAALTFETATGMSLKLDGTADEYTFTGVAGSGLLIQPTLAELKTSAGSVVTLSETGAEILDPLGAGVKIDNGKVALGGPSAELLDLFDQVLSELSTVLTALSTSTHIGNLGFPTAPPTDAATYVTSSTKIATIQGLLSSIKGSL